MIIEDKEALVEKMYAIKHFAMTAEEADAFQSATYYFLCQIELKSDRVRNDHHMNLKLA